jgi:hypothetical protein
MSIKGNVEELERIRLELKALKSKKKTLSDREKEVLEEIRQYLVSKGQPGVKHNGIVIKLDKVEKRQGTKEEKEREAKLVLERYGITSNVENVLEEILEARRGQAVEKDKLIFTTEAREKRALAKKSKRENEY